jgi:anti-sigma-K factor RskA
MIDDDDIDGLAAEYVLGSLDHSERKAVDARRLRDVKLHEAIEAWERRLGTLSDRSPGVAPPADLYPRILARIERIQPLHRFAAIIPRSRLRRRIVAAAVALAACLLLALGWIVYSTHDAPGMLVAQLHRAGGDSTADEGHLPAFAVAIDPRTRSLTIRPVAVRPVSGKSYALWLVQKAGATPRLLGSISASRPTTLPWHTGRPLEEFVNSRLVISLEPDGGPPKSAPTVPIAFAGSLVATDSIQR